MITVIVEEREKVKYLRGYDLNEIASEIVNYFGFKSKLKSIKFGSSYISCDFDFCSDFTYIKVKEKHRKELFDFILMIIEENILKG